MITLHDNIPAHVHVFALLIVMNVYCILGQLFSVFVIIIKNKRSLVYFQLAQQFKNGKLTCTCMWFCLYVCFDECLITVSLFNCDSMNDLYCMYMYMQYVATLYVSEIFIFFIIIFRSK